MAFQTDRTQAYDEDLRWRMVYQRYALELTYREIATSTVQRVVQRFEESGTVTKDPYPKGHNHPSQILTEVDELLIIHLVLDRPSIYLHEIQKELAETTGTAISVPTLCNFLHKNGFSRKKLGGVALQRSEQARDQFRSTISIYKPPMLVFIDETGTDRRDAMRRFGYSL